MEPGFWARLRNAWDTADQRGPSLMGMVKSGINAAQLPGDVYAGRVDPMSDEGIRRAADLAGTVTGGAYGMPGVRNATGMGIRAYHGSPHDFDRFDISKIGTGEGAQSYGRGLYFAENPQVAQSYKDRLSKKNIGIQDANIIDAMLGRGASDAEIIKRLHERGNIYAEQELAAFKRGFQGRMYEVDINSHPDQFLDWDKTIREQSPQVISNLNKIGRGPHIDDAKVARLDDLLVDIDNATGVLNHEVMKRDINSPRFDKVRDKVREYLDIRDYFDKYGTFYDAGWGGMPASELVKGAERDLLQSGIHGVKYLDQGSRFNPKIDEVGRNRTTGLPTYAISDPATGQRLTQGIYDSIEEAQAVIDKMPQKTNNYVVFDDKLIDIKRKYRKGGATMANTQLPWQARQAAKNMRSGSGMLKSIVPGRTDKLPMSVPAGSYVIPADIVSGLGQGNSDAGGNVLNKMFKKTTMTPGKTGAASRIKRGNTPKFGKIRYADGGGVGEPTPIVAAGGEFIIDPEVVLEIGGGDMERGHEILDAFVKRARQKVIKTLQKLPGPAK